MNDCEMEQTGACKPQNADGTVEFFETVREYFAIGETDLRTYSPLALAFIGDAIYDLVIRSVIVGQGSTKTSQLHRHTSHLVKAEAQAEMIDGMLPEMTEEEQSYYRRGVNAKPPTMPKNATAEDYHKATGFETLMGYLYMTGQTERMLSLIRTGLCGLGAPESEGIIPGDGP